MEKKPKIIIIVLLIVISLLILPDVARLVSQTYMLIFPDHYSDSEYFAELPSVETAVAFMERYPDYNVKTNTSGTQTAVILSMFDWVTEREVSLYVLNLLTDEPVRSIITCIGPDGEKGDVIILPTAKEVTDYPCVD